MDKIQALRDSILTQEEQKAHIEKTRPEIKEIEKLKTAIKRRELPCLLIYITGEGQSRHAEFFTTIEHPAGAELCKEIIDSNRAAFHPVSNGDAPVGPH